MLCRCNPRLPSLVPANQTQTLTGTVGGKVQIGSILDQQHRNCFAIRLVRSRCTPHESVNHSVSEYVRDQAHTNGIESNWALLKRGYHGTYHKMSKKHLNRYVQEFSGRHNFRSDDTLGQLEKMVINMEGKTLTYKQLTN